jgi:hypothetical protein
MSGSPDLAALRVMLRRLGVGPGLAVALAVTLGKLRGEPFQELPRAADRDERRSREQIGPAILLHRVLRARGLAPEPALALVREVVLAAGVVFLGRVLGPLRRADLERLDDAGRLEFARRKGARFFNATVRWDDVRADRVRFTVTACRFPGLCAAVGASALAPLFCEVDAAYFGHVEPGVTLERPATLAAGGAECPFTLRWSTEEAT